MFVVTATPHRISFFGGGTDLPDFYRRTPGAVVGTTINKFVYVTAKAHGTLFEEPFRLNYSETELADRLEHIRNDIARETLRALQIAPPIYISTVADLPSGTGLGSSSCFAVGLAQALTALSHKRLEPAALAEFASHIEIDVLRKPIGKQDQYNAAVGGLNHYRFNPNGSVATTSVRMPRERIDALFDSFVLLWTGITRSADSVLKEQRKNIEDRMTELCSMRDAADESLHLLESPNFCVKEFGELLDVAWRTKRTLAATITNPRIDDAYARALQAGAYGGKLCGAGAGGFLLFCAPPDRKRAICEALSEFTEVRIAYEPAGARILFPAQHLSVRQIPRTEGHGTLALAS